MQRRPHRARRAASAAGGTILLLLSAALAGCAYQAAYHTRVEEMARGAYADPAAADGAPARHDAAAARPDSLVVATYNIQFAARIDEALADLAAEPHLARADILLLQEMDPAGCERIARARGYDFVYWPSTVHTHHGRPFGNAILARGRIENPRFVPLPRKGPLGVTSRIAVGADVTVRGFRMRVVSLHLSTIVVGRPARLIQARAAVDSLLRVPGPALCGGDFNTQGEDDTLAVADELRRGGLERVDLPAGCTIRPNALRLFQNVQVLDHVFYRGLRPLASGVFGEARGSDHYPVWALFERPAAGAAPPR